MPLLSGERYWVPHKEHAYVPAMYKCEKKGEALFVDGSGEEHRLALSVADNLGRVVDTQLDGVDNICTLSEVTEAAVLQTVKVRYLKKAPQVYTSVAQILIAVNPFQNLPIYSHLIMKKYLEAGDVSDQEPHIFSIGSYAIRSLCIGTQESQVVLISGESGAGKTESTKLILSYTAEALSGGKVGEIQDKIMRSNPILESFGNAMTVRNNNSSRFGKFIDIKVAHTTHGHSIRGCMISDYLLEQTRVTGQAEGERNYHLFFQLLYSQAQLESPEFLEGRDKISPIGLPSSYRYIKNSQHIAPSVDDRQFFEEHLEAYRSFGITKVHQHEIFRIVLAVLTMGNAEISAAGEHCEIKDLKPVKDVAQLLGVKAEPIQNMLEKRQLKVGNEVTETGRTVAQAEAARDGVARKLYGRLFKYVLRTMNKTLMEGTPEGGQFMGVLDIAGFESFEVNSIEQLSINLSNEHLQAHFNTQIFAMELADYKLEGVNVQGSLTYQDNTDIIALIDSKSSILSCLDEHISVPKATDKTFLEKVIKTFSDHPRFIKSRFGASSTFGVQHFAGPVNYQVTGFLEKNIDKPPDECVDVFKNSTLEVLREIGEGMQQELGENVPSGKKKIKTVSSTFRASLAALMSKISEAQPHFIRCIKPNASKVPNLFTAQMVMNQLSFSGVFEAVRIRQSGFSTRMLFKDFIGRYKAVLPRGALRKVSDHKEACQYMLDRMADLLGCVGTYTPGDILLGKTKIFLRQRVVQLLDKAHALSVVGYVIQLQSFWRGVRTRKLMKVVLEVNKELTQWMKHNNYYSAPGFENTAFHKLATPDNIQLQLEVLDPVMQRAKELILPLRKSKEKRIEKTKHRMKMEMETVRAVSAKTDSVDVLELERIVSRSKELELSHLPMVESLKKRIADLRIQLPLFEALQNQVKNEDADIEDLQDVLSELQRHKLDVEPDRWLKQLDGSKITEELIKRVGALSKAKAEEAAREAQEAVREAAEEAAELEKQQQAAEAAGAPIPDQSTMMKKQKHKKQKKEKPEPRQKKDRLTITDISADDYGKILIDLVAAIEVYDVDKLHKTLGDAIKNGVEEQSVLKEAQELFANMEREDFLTEKTQDLVKNIRDSIGDENNNLTGLKNIKKQALKLGVAQDAVQVANAVIQDKFRKRLRNTFSRNVFTEVDFDYKRDLLVDDAFADLSTYKMLREKNSWLGHGSGRFFNVEKGPEVMLKHNVHALKQSLTKLDAGLELNAGRTFKNIMCWMHDQACSDLTRVNLITDLIKEAGSDHRMAAEVYCQLMKQLTGNPSTRSRNCGYKLLLALVQNVRPPSELSEYVHVFILKHLGDSIDAESRNCLEQAIADLNRTSAPEKQGGEVDSFPVTVTLMDHSKRKVFAGMSTTVQQLGEMVREQLALRKEMDWCLFQSTRGLDSTRLIPQDATVATTIQKWNQFKDKTMKDSWFVFKRRFLTTKESLDPAYPNDCRLTFVQALDEYRRYPIQESIRFVVEVAGRILYLEHEHFRREIKNITDGNLMGEGILEQLLPATTIREHSRRMLSYDVLKVLHKHPAESRHVTMGRCFNLFQKMKLFGSSWWFGKQCLHDVEEYKTTISDKKYMQARKHWATKHGVDTTRSTDRHCNVNPRNKKMEYLLAVDYYGIRFMQAQDKVDSGQPMFSRGFMFNEDSWERVLVWGAKANVLQLIVTTVNPECPDVGRVPMRINFQTPAAVDICFTLHTLYVCRGQEMAC